MQSFQGEGPQGRLLQAPLPRSCCQALSRAPCWKCKTPVWPLTTSPHPFKEEEEEAAAGGKPILSLLTQAMPRGVGGHIGQPSEAGSQQGTDSLENLAQQQDQATRPEPAWHPELLEMQDRQHSKLPKVARGTQHREGSNTERGCAPHRQPRLLPQALPRVTSSRCI